MSLDIQTLYLVASLVATMLGGLLLFFWRQEKIPALGWWGAAYMIGGISIAGWTFAPDDVNPLLLLPLHIAGFVACGMVWTAARVFHGRDPLYIAMCAGAALWAIATLSAMFDSPPAMRMLIGCALVAVYVCLTAGELWRERRQALRSKRAALIVPSLHGLVLMLPIVLGEILLADGAPLQAHSGWIAGFSIQLMLYVVGTVFIIFLLMSERVVAVHKLAASVDPLTGLFNRRGFSEAAARMIAREERAGRPVTVLIFDIDHFKSVNDRFGHPAGDEVLKLFALVLTRTLRVTDIIGRIGGEEFVAMLPCTIPEAVIAAERVREAFETSGIEVDDLPIVTTVSTGVAGGEPGTEFEVLLPCADTALYAAKRGGRNRVEVADGETPLSLEKSRLAQASEPKVVVSSRTLEKRAA
jgi:diguanylate cyclase (GGDEF)-like protein